MDTYCRKLLATNPLREPVLRAIIEALHLPAGSHGLDAGCGIGLQVLLLADAVGPDGRVTGLDQSTKLLSYAEQIAADSRLEDRVAFRQGDVHRLPFEDNAFDWVWSCDCVGYPAKDPVPLLRELARVVRPGGLVAVLAWSSQQLLPGHPRLEARLNATSSGIAPFTRGTPPAMHFTRAQGWFREAGLDDPQVRTFAGDVQAPMSEQIRTAMIELLDMRWTNPGSEFPEEDRMEYERLCRPESPDFILDLPDYYAFFTYSLFSGRVGE